METACTDLKRYTNARSITHKRQFDEIQTFSQKILEIVRYENKRTRENIIEMERSINALSATGEFELVTQSRKENKEKDRKTIPGQSSTEVILSDTEEEDTEITFAKVVITNTASSSEESDVTNTSNSSQESDALNTSSCSKEPEETLTETRGEFSKNRQRQ